LLLPPYNPAPHYRRIYQQVFIKRYHIPVLADLTDKFPNFTKPFDFIYDWGLLHHIGPRKRKTYTKNVATSLKPKGLYVAFLLAHVTDPLRKKYRRGTGRPEPANFLQKIPAFFATKGRTVFV